MDDPQGKCGALLDDARRLIADAIRKCREAQAAYAPASSDIENVRLELVDAAGSLESIADWIAPVGGRD